MSDRATSSPEPRGFNEHGVVYEYFAGRNRSGVMIDVGAFKGSSFEPFLELGWEVHAFEPDPSLHRELREEYESRRLHLYDCAVSDKAQDEAPFYVAPEVASISTLRPFLESHRERYTVRVRTLDQVMEERRIERVDFLKIDAEGFDLPVLQGFPWRRSRFPWRRSRPTVVLCEFEDFKTLDLGYGVHDLGKFLLSRQYRVFLSEWYPIEKYGGHHRWRTIRPYPCTLEDTRAWGNFLAVVPEEAESFQTSILDSVLSDRRKQLASLNDRDGSLQRTQVSLEGRNSMIQTLRTSISGRNTTIRSLKDALVKRDIKITALEVAIGKRDKALEERSKSLERTREDLKQRNQTIRELREAIRHLDAKITTLQAGDDAAEVEGHEVTGTADR